MREAAFTTANAVVYQGHTLDVLREMPDESVDCVVTSPPFWGLRAYGTDPQVWDNDPSCEHTWGDVQTGRVTGPGVRPPDGKAAKGLGSIDSPSERAFCTKCLTCNAEHDWATTDEYHNRGDATAGTKQKTNIGSVTERGTVRYATCRRCAAWKGELGQEPTPDLFVKHLVSIFREVKRVLKPHGTFWLEIGDTYAAFRDGVYVPQTLEADHHDPKRKGKLPGQNAPSRMEQSYAGSGIKSKDLVGIPWMLAFALRSDGWWLRSDIIWHRTSAMPESVRDRPTAAHSHIFLFAKSERYFYDPDAVREAYGGKTHHDITGPAYAPPGQTPRAGSRNTYNKPGKNSRERVDRDPAHLASGGKNGPSRGKTWEERKSAGAPPRHGLDGAAAAGDSEWATPTGGRNMRNVWTLGPEPLSIDSEVGHYASFPTEIPRRAILAGTSLYGVCAACGSPYTRVIERGNSEHHHRAGCGHVDLGDNDFYQSGSYGGFTPTARDTGEWKATCQHGGGEQPDDLELIETPTGERAGDDPSLVTGRAGMNRPRGDNEGRRLITRYEQRKYAEQLRSSEHRAEMEEEAGSAFAHYVRTDRSGARPVPPSLLDSWIERGWLERVVPPATMAAAVEPAVVLDPFSGSGTTGLVAASNGRRYVGIELNPAYVRLSQRRIAEGELERSRLSSMDTPLKAESVEDLGPLWSQTQ